MRSRYFSQPEIARQRCDNRKGGQMKKHVLIMAAITMMILAQGCALLYSEDSKPNEAYSSRGIGAQQAPTASAAPVAPSAPSGALNASVEPDRDFIVRGIVTDEKGNGLPGVTLTASAGIGSLLPTGETQTDKEGRYLLQFGPGFWSTDTSKVPTQFATISPSKEGYFDSNFNRQDSLWIGDHIPAPDESCLNIDTNRFLTPHHPFELNFVLLPATALEGRLLEPNGQPAADRWVGIIGDMPPSGGSISKHARTDFEGHFEFTDMPTIGRWWFSIEEGCNEYRSEKINVAPDIEEYFELQISSEGGTRQLVVQKCVR
jgi:hypothetical protein